MPEKTVVGKSGAPGKASPRLEGGGLLLGPRAPGGRGPTATTALACPLRLCGEGRAVKASPGPLGRPSVPCGSGGRGRPGCPLRRISAAAFSLQVEAVTKRPLCALARELPSGWGAGGTGLLLACAGGGATRAPGRRPRRDPACSGPRS